jgi:poly(3-hydroxybutyrate) depolymerase
LNRIGHLNIIESLDAQLIIDFFKSVSNFGPRAINLEPRFKDDDSQLLEEFINVNGRDRRFKIFIPGIYFRTGGDVPLVFVFHGSLGSPENMIKSSNMNDVAENENFIVVFPASRGPNFEVFDLDENNDLDFALEMIAFMKTNYRVNTDAIYSHGYSNGGFLSHMLACKYSGVFAGIAPMAGTFDHKVFPECAPTGKVPVLQIHGTSDSFVPYDGNRQIISVEETLSFWASANGDETTPTITEFSSRDDLFTYPPSNIVQHYRLNRIGHLNIIESFDAQLIIDFFKSVSNFESRTIEPRFSDNDSELIEEFIQVNGKNRRFKIFIPGIYSRTNVAVPLVFVFHGSLGSPENMLGSSNMNEIAETENFIAVYPAANGANFEVFDLETNNDIDFALIMIDYLKANYRIKENSIYSHGFSNGGFLSHMLACKHSETFAAIAPMAGTFDPKVFPNCAPTSTIPVLQIHGTNDFFVPYDGNRQIISVEETLGFWANANGQDSTPVVTEVSSRVDLFSYPPQNIVQHYRLERVGHLDVIEAFDAQFIIDFFKGVSEF